MYYGHGLWFGILIDDEDRLVASAFFPDRESLRKHLRSQAHDLPGIQPEEAKDGRGRDMHELFEGKPVRPTTLSYSRVSNFQGRVYDLLLGIPRGRVTTYGRISSFLGSGPRAVGTAVASNPWPLFVPCHRVVPATLAVGNYSMSGRPSAHGTNVKREILQREGVRFHEERISPSSLWDPSRIQP